MLVDLVRTEARDGVRLDGMFLARAGSPQLGLDGVCLVHGTGGNFYSSALFEAFAERLTQLGVGVLRVNTRGHDGISNATTSRGGRRLGAAYEVLDDCRHDLAAWSDWLRAHAGPRVALLGHSSGAVKCLYAAAHEPRLGVERLVAVSPPRLSYSGFCSSPEGPNFLATFREAERLVQAGQPGALLDVRLPLPFVITAGGYVEKYGPDERYNYLSLVRSLSCPTLFLFGGEEVAQNMAFRNAPEEVAALAAGKSRVTVATVPGADHFYTGVREAAVARAEQWLRAE